MQIKVTDDLEKEGLDGWILTFLQDAWEGPGSELDVRMEGAIQGVIDSKEFEAKPNRALVLRPLGRIKVSRLVLVGLGKREDLTAARVHKAYAIGARTLRELGCKRIGAMLPPDTGQSAERVSQTIAEGLIIGTYDFNKYKTSDEAPKTLLECFVQGGSAAGIEHGRIMSVATNLARDVANEVPTVATPAYVAGIAEGMASERLKCTVLDEANLAERGMQAILSVGRGSVNPPRMVALEYRGGAADGPLYAVVGKGVTFDSGGLSLKPAASMEEMKFDKCGACAVLGVMQAVAELGLKVNVLGVLGLAENLPGGTAYKPGDIVRTAAGKTIEVLNTDAEGRVVLADALYYAGLSKPVAMVDLATLTGACVVALGDVASGIMGNDAPLIKDLIEAGELTGERLWQLPLWPEYDEKVKSEVADLKNIGERSGGTAQAGAIAGASFLKAFVPEGCAWAHLDIAGTAWDSRKKAFRGGGATGLGVRLVVEWLRSKE